MKLSNQVSKLTEMVADLKVGPRSRRSSASSRKSGDSDVTNLIENEAFDSFIEGEDIPTIFGAFVAETGHPLNIKASWDPDILDEVIARPLSLEDHDVIRLYTGLSAQHQKLKSRTTDEMATKIKGLILQAIEEVTAPTSNSLIKCIETMAEHQNTSADITGKIDAVRAANADVQRMTELLSNIKVSSQQKAEAFKSEGAEAAR
ncbi:hypothetical protein FPRO03_08433 [Fusarium proliferatum]|nr:hypothetical protein FPRO03_08433 [Fusarium proliferatum]